MNQKELAQTGVKLPEIGIGTWDYHAGPGPLRKGLECGGAWFIDTAESYATEEVVGQAMAGLRERVFLAAKVSPHNFRRDALERAVDASLRRLGTDVIDLLQLHQPNPEIPIEETMGAMAGLVDAGKVRFVGVSNFSVAQLQQAQRALGRYPVVSNQVRYNLVDRTIEGGLLPYCEANRITVIAYSPLARSFERIRDGDPNRILDRIARSAGKTAVQVALNWCLSKPAVVVIPKGNSEAHILENCGASGWYLTAGQIGELDAIQYRRRNRIDSLLRKYTPGVVRPLALHAARYLPRQLRRRIT